MEKLFRKSMAMSGRIQRTRRSNDGIAVTLPDPAAQLARIKLRPDPLAQVLDCEGVVALVKIFDSERATSLGSDQKSSGSMAKDSARRSCSSGTTR
jgi:hypothetical protein